MKKVDIARDYHLTALPVNDIANKHNVSRSQVSRYAVEHPYNSVATSKFTEVLKITPKDIEAAKLILQDNGINFETVNEFQLIEFFESSINS